MEHILATTNTYYLCSELTLALSLLPCLTQGQYLVVSAVKSPHIPVNCCYNYPNDTPCLFIGQTGELWLQVLAGSNCLNCGSKNIRLVKQNNTVTLIPNTLFSYNLIHTV